MDRSWTPGHSYAAWIFLPPGLACPPLPKQPLSHSKPAHDGRLLREATCDPALEVRCCPCLWGPTFCPTAVRPPHRAQRAEPRPVCWTGDHPCLACLGTWKGIKAAMWVRRAPERTQRPEGAETDQDRRG